MSSFSGYTILYVNCNKTFTLCRWNPDAIVFDSWQQYGTPSYWMQYFFRESSGATLLPAMIQANSSIPVVASAIIWQDSEDSSKYLKIKVSLLQGPLYFYYCYYHVLKNLFAWIASNYRWFHQNNNHLLSWATVWSTFFRWTFFLLVDVLF